MELALGNGFCELTMDDMEMVDGGKREIDWYSIGMGTSMAAGAFIGGAIGTAVCPGGGTVLGSKAGTVAGSLIGGVVGGVIYSIV